LRPFSPSLHPHHQASVLPVLHKSIFGILSLLFQHLHFQRLALHHHCFDSTQRPKKENHLPGAIALYLRSRSTTPTVAQPPRPTCLKQTRITIHHKDITKR
jgi:hypothetical protein